MTSLQTYIETPLIGDGNDGKVYAISDNHVVKVPLRKYERYRRNLIKEANIANELYSNGISVPKPEGIQKVNLLWNKEKENIYNHNGTIEGFVMQRIHSFEGLNLYLIADENLIEEEKRKMLEQMQSEEIKKVKELGFIPIDEGSVNTLYEPLENKIYLIDFFEWKKI